MMLNKPKAASEAERVKKPKEMRRLVTTAKNPNTLARPRLQTQPMRHSPILASKFNPTFQASDSDRARSSNKCRWKRSEERRGGKEGDSTSRTRWTRDRK